MKGIRLLRRLRRYAEQLKWAGMPNHPAPKAVDWSWKSPDQDQFRAFENFIWSQRIYLFVDEVESAVMGRTFPRKRRIHLAKFTPSFVWGHEACHAAPMVEVLPNSGHWSERNAELIGCLMQGVLELGTPRWKDRLESLINGGLNYAVAADPGGRMDLSYCATVANWLGEGLRGTMLTGEQSDLFVAFSQSIS